MKRLVVTYTYGHKDRRMRGYLSINLSIVIDFIVICAIVFLDMCMMQIAFFYAESIIFVEKRLFVPFTWYVFSGAFGAHVGVTVYEYLQACHRRDVRWREYMRRIHGGM